MMTTDGDGRLPLVDVRVLDLASGAADAIGRLFADLGADVLKVEPPGGSLSRRMLPAVAGSSISFALHNANKRSIVLNPDADKHRFLELVANADILIDSGIPGRAGRRSIPTTVGRHSWMR